MRLFIPRVPSANRFNRDAFAAAWMYAYGGTWQNAVSAWRVDCLEALKRQLVAAVNDAQQPEEPITDERDW